MQTALTAHTRDANTPDTDKMSTVWHVVTDKDGVEYEVRAACPLSAMEQFGRGEGIFPRRSIENLNKTIANYSDRPNEQAVYVNMMKSSQRLAAQLLSNKAGACADIMGNWWWVSPVEGSLELVCSPDYNPLSDSEAMTDNFFLVSEVEGQGLDDLLHLTTQLDAWFENPVVKFGNQDEMDNIVFQQTRHFSITP